MAGEVSPGASRWSAITPSFPAAEAAPVFVVRAIRCGTAIGSYPPREVDVVTADEVRAVAQTLPRSYEVLVRGRIKFRVGQIVWLALSKDGERMGCGFPKELRQAAVDAEPHKFELPGESDMRFNWIHVRLDAIDADEMRDLVEEAWSRAVPLFVAEAYGRTRGYM
jgi:hypothetical protein